MKTVRDIVITLCVLLLTFLSGWRLSRPVPERVHVEYDTIVRRDTIRDTVPVPLRCTITLCDTFYIPVAPETPDSSAPSVAVPMVCEQQRFKSNDYDIGIEGWRPETDTLRRFAPRLLWVELYPANTTIQPSAVRTKPRRWGIGIQTGVGFSASGISPYMGVGVSYNLITF